MTAGLADHLEMTTTFKGMGAADELVARLKLASLREAVSGSCHMVINGENPSDLLRDSWKHVVVDTAGGFAAGKIGDWYHGTPTPANSNDSLQGSSSQGSSSQSTPCDTISRSKSCDDGQ